MGLLETAAATLVSGERRIEVTARNITNANTPGYKREVAFTELVDRVSPTGVQSTQPDTKAVASKVQGTLLQTGKAFDLSVSGSGYMLVRDGDSFALTRGGQFTLGHEGRVIDALGRALQQAGGGDLELDTVTPTVLHDGTVLDGEVPVGAVALYTIEASMAAGQLSAGEAAGLEEDPDSLVMQGMLERSNVTLSDEMVEMMKTQRQVEAGAQMVRAYDQLMSQAISTFSRSGA